MRVLERQRAGQFVVLLVEGAAGDEQPDPFTRHGCSPGPQNGTQLDPFAVASPVAARYRALKSSGNVACVCARCCGRRPNSTTVPGFISIETTAARPAINSSPFSQPDASTFTFG